MTERVRSLLAQVTPFEPQASEGLWDAGSVVPAGGFTLSESNRRVTSQAPGPVRGIRCNVPMITGAYYWETLPFHATVSNSRVGIVEADYDLASGINDGSGATSAFVVQNSGNVWWNGVFVGAIGAITSADRACHHLDLGTGTYRVRKNNGAWLTVTTDLQVKGGWYPAVMEFSSGRSWRIYTGGTLGLVFLYPVPAGAVPYSGTVWTPRYLWIASGRMPAGIGGGSPFEYHPGCIAADQDVEIDREGSCWPWGAAEQSKRGQIVIVNADGQRDYWRNWRWRGAEIILRRGREGDAYGSYQHYSTGRVDRLDPTDRSRLVIVEADPLSDLDRALQRREYPANHANAQAAARPRPIVIGRPLYCEGILQATGALHADARAHEVHDGFRDHAATGNLTQIDAVFDKGDVFDPPPTDWTYWPPSGQRRGFKLVNVPDGKIVCNPVAETVSGDVWEHVRNVAYMLYTRGLGYWDGRLNLATLQALQDEAPYRVAAYLREPITALEALRVLLDGFTARLVPNRQGNLVVFRLREPDSKDVVVTLDQTSVKGRVPVPVRDQARGLTATLAGRQNNSPHGDSDLAGSVSPALREELKSPWIVVRRAAIGILHALYDHAISAPLKGTWLQDEADIWAEINRVCTLYRVPRHFYSLTALLTDQIADTLEPGSTVRLVWPRYGLAGGKNLLVAGVRSRFFSRTVNLKLWG